jgi:hypothetical protein
MADAALDGAAVRRRLGLGGEFDELLADLAGIGAAAPATLPGPDEAAGTLARMRVPADELPEALAALPDPAGTPELWWLLERLRHRLLAGMGGHAPMPSWPDLPERLGAAGRWFYLAVFLATVPDLRRFHAEHGVPEEVTWDTLGDVGDKVVLRRRTRGTGGLDKQDWFTIHFRGVLYALGRLQYNLHTVRSGGGGLTPGAPALGVHIPESGPLDPAACDASLARARGFFDGHLGVDAAVARCHSWLLDDQLAEYLPAESNILRFQRRFRLLPGGRVSDRDILEFVFRRVDPDLDTLPRGTTLQRAVVDHLRAGRHWRLGVGWLPLA